MRTSFCIAAFCAALLLPSGVISQARDVPTDGPFVAAYDAAQPAREAYFSGDFSQVVALATPLADAGNAVAQNLLATLFTDAAYAGFDYDKGMQLYQAAADQGYAKAFHNIGLTHLNDLPGHPADEAAAAEAFRAGAETGYLSSYAQLINLRLFGSDAVQDPADGQVLIAQALALDPTNPEILFQAGEAAYTGTGEPEDNVKALQLYRQAADQDHPEANFAAGYMLSYGLGAALDNTAANAYFSRAVSLGHIEAHGLLAQSLLYGYASEPDPQGAMQLAKAGADRGDALSMAVAGEIHEDGLLGEPDYAQARDYYTRAHEAGYTRALILLADLAYFGQGEPVDYDRFFALVSQAVAEGDTFYGPYNVGYAQLYAVGTEQDIPAALGNLETAWAGGYDLALGEIVTILAHPDYPSPLQDPILGFAYCIKAREVLNIDSDPEFFDTAVVACELLDSRLTENQKGDAAVLAEGL